MKHTIAEFVGLVTVLAFSLVTFQGSFSAAFADTKYDVEVTVKVNEKGFFDEKNRLLGPQHPIKVPKGKRVKVTFVFDEAPLSLAIGDVHQLAVTADDGWTIESEKIWVFHPETSVTFVAGEGGKKQYRAYCIIDCIGMDHLNNLVIKVV